MADEKYKQYLRGDPEALKTEVRGVRDAIREVEAVRDSISTRQRSEQVRNINRTI